MCKSTSLSPHADVPFPAIPDSNGHACEACLKKQHLIFPLPKTKTSFKQKNLSDSFFFFSRGVELIIAHQSCLVSSARHAARDDNRDKKKVFSPN
jgi:hypothetical protein